MEWLSAGLYFRIGIGVSVLLMVSLIFDPLFKNHLRKQPNLLTRTGTCLMTASLGALLWPMVVVLAAVAMAMHAYWFLRGRRKRGQIATQVKLL